MVCGNKQRVESSGAKDHLERFGVAFAEIDARIEDPDDEDADFYVDPENGDTVRVFQHLATQWEIISGMGGNFYAGLKYESILPTLKLMGIKKKHHAGIFEGLRIMESAAMRVLNDRG